VGRRLSIITNGGGPAVMAADWADTLGLDCRPRHDLGEDAEPAAYVTAMKAAVADATVDGVLFIFSPKAGTDADAVAAAVGEVFSPHSKPVLGCWMGEVQRAFGASPAQQQAHAGVPHARAAVDAFNSIASFYRNQQLLQQTPPPLSDGRRPTWKGARLLIEGVLAERRKVLTEMESKALLAAFHIR
jgi:acetyltransferase